MSNETLSYLHNIYSRLKSRGERIFSSSSSIASSASSAFVQTPISETAYFDIYNHEVDINVTESQDYCMIDTSKTMSTKQILNLINRQPFAFSESHQTDIVCEFNTLLIEIKSVCHRLDKCRKAIQFAQTKETIGKDLIHIIHFIINRYYCDPLYGNSFISLIGLLMVALQVLDTEDEVQRQLMDENHIGRIIMMQMSAVLELVKSTYTYYLSIDSQIELFKIALDYQFEREDINHIWFPVLKETCLLLTRRDPNWDCKGEYDNICSMATSLLFD